MAEPDVSDRWLNVPNRIRGEDLDFAEVNIRGVFRREQRVYPHAVKHDLDTRLWCGPAVISAITGEPTSRIRELVRRRRRAPNGVVTGINDNEIGYVLKRLGYQMQLSHFYHSPDLTAHPTLAAWLRTTARVPYIAYLIGQLPTGREPEGHWAVVLGEDYYCTQADGWVSLDKAPTRRSRVSGAFAISRGKNE